MERQIIVVLYLLLLIAVIVSLDFLFFGREFWENHRAMKIQQRGRLERDSHPPKPTRLNPKRTESGD